MNNGVSLRAIARKVLRPYYIYKKGNNYFVCVGLKNKTGDCVVLSVKVNKNTLDCCGNHYLLIKKKQLDDTTN